MKYILPALLLVTLILPACERKVPAPGPEEREKILADAPEIFAAKNDGATLRGIESLYLGQPKGEALDALAEFCPKTMEYRGGELSKNAWFRGCVLPEPKGDITSIRVGFWPDLGDQVSTLEIKRKGVELAEVRERFRDFVDELNVDLPHPGMLEMRGERYQVLADIDDGAEGPAHITLGYTQAWANKLEEK